MAKTSTSVGMGITVTLLGILLLATFILAVVFYGQKQRLQRDLDAERAQTRDVMTPSDREQFQDLFALAQENNESFVRFLATSLRETMREVTGNAGSTLADLQTRLETIEGAETAALLTVTASLREENERLEQELAQARQARDDALADLQAEVARVEALQASHQETIAALNSELDSYASRLDEYRASVESTVEQNNTRVEEIRAGASETEANLRDQIASLEQEVLVQQEVIDDLRAERTSETLKPADEAALVDARVIGTDAPRGQVVIDVGRDKRVVLGMTFEVYSDAASIRPGPDGEYPRGKATIEVIRIDPTSALCRIVRENRGNPIVVGDASANAVYDPNKTYTFVVFGNFDADRDGVATPQERRSIASLVGGWGGNVVDELTGDVDFLVLGQRPILPPEPPPDAPIVVIQEFIRKQQDAREYDRLFDIAIKTGIPVLNENRLYTLTGFSGAG